MTTPPIEPVTDLGEIVVTGRRSQNSGPGFSLSTFMAEINIESILESSRHLMQFTLPRGLVNSYDPQDVRSIMLRCDTSALPGVSFAESEEIRRYGIGPGTKQPYMPIFGPISTSYIVDGGGVIHGFFYDWMSYIIGFDSTNGMDNPNTFGANPYEVAYKDDYVCDAKIFVHNQQNDRIIEIVLHNAYPIAMDPVPLSWGATDEYMKLGVTWDYTDWSAKYYDKNGSMVRDINALRTVTDGANKLAGFAQTVGLPSAVTNAFSKIASKTQRINDIASIISGGKKTIIDTVKTRFGF